MMGAFGLILGCVGLDAISASSRLTFDVLDLESGFSFVAIGMGLFGIGEIMINIEEVVPPEIVRTKIKNLFPSVSDWMQSKWAILRGTDHWVWLGNTAWWRTDDFLVYILCGREKDIEDP